MRFHHEYGAFAIQVNKIRFQNNFLKTQNCRYEELLASHEGLLQLLESHVKEIQNYNKENEKLREEIKSLKLRAADVERNFRQMCEKYLALKKRRDLKVAWRSLIGQFEFSAHALFIR